jgi:putative tributyrin esterase
MRILTRTWRSTALGRDKSVTVVLPPGYSGGGPPMPVLYLLHSFGGNRTSWLRCASFLEQAAAGGMIVVLPESGRSWLINDHRGRRYEDYLVGEVVGYVDEHFHTVRERDGRALAGFSMGGACALFHGLRHVDVYATVASCSGAFEAPLREGDPYMAYRDNQRLMMPNVRDHERVWGPPGSPTRRRYDPYRLLSTARPAGSLSVYLEVGLDDFERMIAMNRNMRDALARHGLPPEYRERPGGHDWAFVDAGLGELFGFVRDQSRSS